MTWAEFKAAVEALGVRDEDELGYIDVGRMGEIAGALDGETGWEIYDA